MLHEQYTGFRQKILCLLYVQSFTFAEGNKKSIIFSGAELIKFNLGFEMILLCSEATVYTLMSVRLYVCMYVYPSGLGENAIFSVAN